MTEQSPEHELEPRTPPSGIEGDHSAPRYQIRDADDMLLFLAGKAGGYCLSRREDLQSLFGIRFSSLDI